MTFLTMNIIEKPGISQLISEMSAHDGRGGDSELMAAWN